MAQQFKSGQDVTDLFEEHKSGQDVSHLFSDDEVTPDSIIEDAKRPLGDEEKPKQKPKEQSFLSKAWHTISDPLTDAPSRFGQSVSDFVSQPKLNETNAANPYIRGFVGGAAKGLGDVVSSMTSPLNAALMLLGGGEFAAAKSGMPEVAQLANYGVKGASAVMGAHGASNVLSPDSTLEQRLMGIPEIAGGILGIRSRVPEISNAMHESVIPEQSNIPYGPESPTFDESGKAIAPPQNVQERPSGPWDRNIGESINKPNADDLTYQLAQDKFNMGRPLPEEQPLQAPSSGNAPIFNKPGTKGKTGSLQSGDDVTHLFENVDKSTGEVIPPEKPPVVPPNEPPSNIPSGDNTPHESSILQQAYDLPRGMISADPPFITSAAFRQGASLIGTKEWFKGWVKAAQSFGSEGAYKKVLEQVNNDPLFQPSAGPNGEQIPAYADQVGLRRTNLSDYSHREEPLRSELAEKIPLYGKYIRASNRAFTAFTNSVGNGVFKNLINDAVQFNKLGKSGGLTGTGDVVPNPFNDLPTGRAIADFVNNSLRRGKIGAEIGKHEINLEKNTKLLSNIFFSPRSISSQVRLLNPSTYAMAPPFVRKQYLGALVRQVGTWWTIAELAKLAGAQVSHDSNSADFGKIRIGNTRIDVPGGLQQFLVLGSRMLSGGSTSTNTGKFTPFGQGFKPETRASTLATFGENRLHPTLKFATDLLGATKKQPFHTLDKSIQMIAPMYADDLMQVLNDNPDLAPIILGLSGAGMGTQTYERGSFGKPVYLNEKHDFNIGR